MVCLLILAICSGCTRERVPPAPAFKPVERDAAVDYRGDASVAGAGEAGSGGGAAGRGGTEGAGGSGEVSPIDPMMQHVSEGCDDFSTGTVHLISQSGTRRNKVLEITVGNSQNRLCGSLPEGVHRPWIRQTDGKMLYLYKGNIHQFVSDPEDALDPAANDPIVNVNHSCAPNPDEGLGPFWGMMLKLAEDR